MNKFWKPEELALFDSPLSNREIAAKTGRSYHAVRLRRSEPRPEAAATAAVATAAQTTTATSTYTDDKGRANAEFWKRQHDDLRKKYDQALAENSVVDQLVQNIMEAAPRSYSPLPPVVKVRPKSKSTPQSAVLLFSDTHVGKVVRPDQTLGFGRYDFPMFLARLKYLEESVISILGNHTTMHVDELVVAMLGDHLDGALAHGSEAGQRSTLFSQFYLAGHATAQFLRVLSAHVPKIRIKTVVGNHTRWQNQKKMPTENRFSNLDMFFYALVEALTRDIKNIDWDLNPQPFAIFQVQGYTFHAAHGDHLRGGDKALGIPNHAIGRELSTKAQLFTKHGRQAPHYYICGHLHRDIQLPHALGDVTINGGFPGLDGYSLTENFNPIDPTQTLFFVHPKFGKTAQYKLSLKFADVGADAPYQLPQQFPIE
ncbi:MAG TPA: hypothetical protein VEH04_17160 [Verrucomicrobiae bacterium]|nr:hypothetical protein [Verrucomicrobiae bacterium]